MKAKTIIDLIIPHQGRKPANRGPFRVTTYNYYPPEDGDVHNAKYFEYLDSAKTYYMKHLVDQVFESRILEYVALERYNEFTGWYEVIFQSHQLHTIVSYGLDPNK